MRIFRAFFSLSLAFFYAHVFCHSKPQNNFLAFGKRFLYWQTNISYFRTPKWEQL